MMNRQTIVLLTLLTAGFAWPADTQGYNRWYARPGVAYGLGGYGYGYGGVGTAYSAQQNANANTIRAMGEATLMGSAAMINYEEARSAYIDNKAKWTQVYLERKRAGLAQQEEERQAMIAKRERGKDFLAANPPPPPDRPNSTQLDASTGQIHWPSAVMTPAYKDQRETLEKLFQLRTVTSTTPDLAIQVDNAVREMKSTLRSHIHDLPAQEYISVRKFLDSLVTEAKATAS